MAGFEVTPEVVTETGARTLRTDDQLTRSTVRPIPLEIKYGTYIDGITPGLELLKSWAKVPLAYIRQPARRFHVWAHIVRTKESEVKRLRGAGTIN
jgi:hypothetical protein